MDLRVRSAFTTHFGTVGRLSIEYFTTHIFPPLPEGLDIDEVMQTLKRMGKKSRRPLAKNGRWRGFAAKAPGDGHRTKEEGFKNFPDVIEAICKAGMSKGFQPTMKLVQETKDVEEDETIHPEDMLPDGCIVPRDVDGPVTWNDVGAIGWYRRWNEDSTRQSNYDQVITTMRYCMKDPRRRFILGYTLVDGWLEFWYMDQGNVVASETLEWIGNAEDHPVMVHFFLAMLFCGPLDFGWDPTVQLVRSLSPSGDAQYDYTVEDADGTQTVYRTLGIIAESSASSSTGKGLRVWRAVEIRDGVPHGDTVVLKDIWRHEEIAQEGSNMRSVAQSDLPEEAREALKRGVLTVLHHGDVIIHVDCDNRKTSFADTLDTHLKNYRRHLPSTDRFPRWAHLLASAWRWFTRPSELSGKRVHYRMVVKEHCVPLREVRWNPAKVYPALAEVCDLLRLVHQNGWVHHDISCGNILIDSDGHARLTDFEFSRKFGKKEGKSIRVGTPTTIACEVQNQYYLFRPNKWQRHDQRKAAGLEADRIPCRGHCKIGKNWNTDKRLKKRRLSVADVEKSTADELSDDSDCVSVITSHDWLSASDVSNDSNSSERLFRGFTYSPLHDLESLLWLLFYFVFVYTNTSVCARDEKPQSDEERSAFSQLLDKLISDKDEREKILTHDKYFRYIYAKRLHPKMRPIAHILEHLRQALVRCYIASEEDRHGYLSPETWRTFYDEYIAAVNKIRDCAVDVLSSDEPSESKAPADGTETKQSPEKDATVQESLKGAHDGQVLGAAPVKESTAGQAPANDAAAAADDVPAEEEATDQSAADEPSEKTPSSNGTAAETTIQVVESRKRKREAGETAKESSELPPKRAHAS